MTVACAMIVRDSAKTLGTALESIAGHVDELVVIDTGSIDKTKALARRYGASVASFPWCDDFSAARQYAYDRCHSDWIMHLDSDDEILGAEHIRSAARAAPDDLGAVYWQYVTERGADGELLSSFWRERMTRRGWYEWRGRAHEVLVPLRPCSTSRDDHVVINHLGHAGAPEAGLERNVRLLRLDLAGQSAPDSRTLFYLARDLMQLHQYDEALSHLTAYLPLASWSDEHYLARLFIGYLHRLAGRWDQAIAMDLSALDVQHAWPDAYFALSEDYYYKEQWARCAYWSELGQRLAPPASALFVSHETYTYAWRIYYAVALVNLGRLVDALAITRGALALHPADRLHLHNLAYIDGKLAELLPDLAGAAPAKEAIS